MSRVLNDRPKVSPETRGQGPCRHPDPRVPPEPARPGAVPRSLPDPRRRRSLLHTTPSAVERLRGVAAALRDSHYDLVLFNVESPVHRDEHFAALTRPRPGRRAPRDVAARPRPTTSSGCGPPACRSCWSTPRGARRPVGRHRRRRGRPDRHPPPRRRSGTERHRLHRRRRPTTRFGFTSSAQRELGYGEVARATPGIAGAAELRAPRAARAARRPGGSPSSCWPNGSRRPRSSPPPTSRPSACSRPRVPPGSGVPGGPLGRRLRRHRGLRLRRPHDRAPAAVRERAARRPAAARRARRRHGTGARQPTSSCESCPLERRRSQPARPTAAASDDATGRCSHG